MGEPHHVYLSSSHIPLVTCLNAALQSVWKSHKETNFSFSGTEAKTWHLKVSSLVKRITTLLKSEGAKSTTSLHNKEPTLSRVFFGGPVLVQVFPGQGLNDGGTWQAGSCPTAEQQKSIAGPRRQRRDDRSFIPLDYREEVMLHTAWLCMWMNTAEICLHDTFWARDHECVFALSFLLVICILCLPDCVEGCLHWVSVCVCACV